MGLVKMGCNISVFTQKTDFFGGGGVKYRTPQVRKRSLRRK